MVQFEDISGTRPYFHEATVDLRHRFNSVKTGFSEAEVVEIWKIWLELINRKHLRSNGSKFTQAGTLYEEVDYRLDELKLLGFAWPFTLAPGGDGSLDGSEWKMDSPLSRLGYSVAGNADQTAQRRRILADAFEGQLPLRDGEKEIWGMARSGQRLHRIATLVAALVRNQKRRTRPSKRAIERWEKDLEWMKSTYYDRTAFAFGWPKIA
ncbi:MAG: hypothetical protein NXI19_04650 [Alphaproteobacteria bacterium]|nr:hypothetical protein [Alphaproteobacteria bacterium]